MESYVSWSELEVKTLEEVNGGGAGGFIVGYMLGAVAGYIATPVMAVCGGTQEECAKVFLSCITIGATLGVVATGPV